MKRLISNILVLVITLAAVSCNDWLSINTDPNRPSNESAPVEIRLPWIQYYYTYSWAVAGVRTNAITQLITANASYDVWGDFIGRYANWNPNQDANITPFQHWYVGAANNIPDIISKAQETGANHYEAAALAIKSMGFIMMCDLFGEVQYTQSISEDFSPGFDTGDVVYAGCLKDLEKAIELFSQPQPDGVTPLSEGDPWCGGDISKWIKLCYGLKARWMGTLSKTGQYDPEGILDALEKALQSNADNVVMSHYNAETGGSSVLSSALYGPSLVWRNAAYAETNRLNRWYINLLTNFKGSGVRDPRASKLIPSAMCNVKLSGDGSKIISYSWMEDKGVNVQGIEDGWKINRYAGGAIQAMFSLAKSDVVIEYKDDDILKYYNSKEEFIRNAGEYYTPESATIENLEKSVRITYHSGAMYANSSNPAYVEDIKYVQLRNDGLKESNGLAQNDMNCYYSLSTATRELGFVQGTGTFYTRPDSDTDIITWSEMCFIKAEVLFRKGDRQGALDAYKEGIRSHFERMNQKLRNWEAQGCCTTAMGIDVSFAYAQMRQEDIDAYMLGPAVCQSAGELTMSDIMMQKFIAMGYNYQNWNDMRRFNYYAGNIADYGVVYTEMNCPVYRTQDRATFKTDDSDDMFYVRRMAQCYTETDYNSSETNKTVVELYGKYGIEGALDYKIYSIPVWWDWTK